MRSSSYNAVCPTNFASMHMRSDQILGSVGLIVTLYIHGFTSQQALQCEQIKLIEH